MSHRQFERLTDDLLRAGIAPRHVRRYIGELRDHFDDLAREEEENGATRQEARAAARARLGSQETLRQQILDRPELRSFSARFPYIAFGVGPVAVLVLVLMLAVLIEAALLEWQKQIHLAGHPFWTISPRAFRQFAAVWNWAMSYVLPLGIAGIFLVVGLRQRLDARWVAFGVGMLCVVGGFLEMTTTWPDGTRPGALAVDFGLLAPPLPQALIDAATYRVPLNLMIMGAACWTWFRIVRRTRIECEAE